MAQPENKHPKIDAELKRVFGVDRQKSIREDKCVSCDGPAKEFRDDLSRKEFTISGMCQKCQDDFFVK